ncbi:DUF4349 domain-containing protein [Flavobacterium psychrophilum]|uniref:DUF4349 domain-containing protein n=2 Tax=Flavobacterium psychrophilum TaxID=96345 RepID=A0A7U2TFH5_FLAPS|nr:DUF4349 domain-containing protein [Flavobacterium psychrophilum]QKQ65083.1 DUF4349 domain-containing protein [Flavobacterium psychrophilum]QRE02818.1 DUF4349 domain-containing protein [Flavobacterium psychrophilum]QRE34167.1 DUF4349 domain-containing protein [Flavobacterium psychrophilum]QRE38947.1 DUF4349 domain-containing protein [Flavobacterium psychrophilum]QRE41333.1 DUF4349 domain-containing protein [Flavobacterium psychrophilum]
MKIMKKTPAIGLALLLVTIAYSCKQASEEAPTAEEFVTENSNGKEVISSAAAVEPENSKRKFVRTSDIKFKVKNVPKSTYAIEDATTKFGGFVTYTNLQSTVSNKDETKVSPDSTLVTTKYTVENNITIRVPNKRLDTVIKTIAKQIDFLDFRVIKADDVTLQILSNQMAQRSSNISEKRLEKAIDSRGKKLDDIVGAEDHLDAKKAQNDASKLENLSINDQVNFSTLTLQIYQREAVKQEMVGNEKSINAYRPNIGLQIWDSLKTGWFMLEAIIAFVVQLWGVALIIGLGYFGYKKYIKK